MPLLSHKIGKFEKDCIKWDSKLENSDKKVLPDGLEGERPQRIMIETLNSISKEDLTKISPDSLTLKNFVKVPMLLFVMGAAMLCSMTEL